MPEEPSPVSQRTVLALIMGGLVLWAIYVAVGTFMSTFSFARALMVLVSMAVFVGFWLLLLWNRGRDKQP